MKISTNCSPLVIYFGFFFPDKTITLAKGGSGWGGAGGWLGCDGRTKKEERGRLRRQTSEQKCVSVIKEHCVLGGLPTCTHTPSLKRKKVDMFAEALSRFIRPPETAFESVHCEIHSSNLDKILTVY